MKRFSSIFRCFCGFCRLLETMKGTSRRTKAENMGREMGLREPWNANTASVVKATKEISNGGEEAVDIEGDPSGLSVNEREKHVNPH